MADSPLRKLFDRALWIRVGEAATLIIKRRTLEGRYLNEDADPAYSTTPMPVFGLDERGKMLRAKLERLVKAGNKNPDAAEAFYRTTKAGRKWLILLGGYKKLRELAGKPTDKVTLSYTGGLLRDLKVLRVMPGGAAGVEVGHRDPEKKKLAEYHNQLGAGKGKKIRQYMGLTQAEVEDEIIPMVQAWMKQNA